MAFRLLIVIAICCCALVQSEIYTNPEQIHISYGVDPTQMIVTWVTMQSTYVTIVEYDKSEKTLTSVAKGHEDVFVDGGSEKRIIYVHRVAITGLTPGQKYYYHCGCPSAWSSRFSFTAMPSGSNWSPQFAVFGDMGNVNAQSVGRLQEETQAGNFDAIIHVGDFAYDFDTDNARFGDAYMNQVQSFAAYVPYMTCPGNHEAAYNFSNYKNRFTMPRDEKHNMFYSIDIGPVHLISFNSEAYYSVQYGWEQIIEQYKWLERDLIEANKPENRAKRPWIISMCHRPMYCDNSNDDEHCPNLHDNLIRVGIPIVHAYGIEDLLYKYGVDVHFSAHEHSYERLWPVYNLTVCNGSRAEPYHNPRGPVHIVTGSAGCSEGVDPFYRIPYPWSAAHSDDYGYTRMVVHNATHLDMVQVSDDQGGAIVDKLSLIKEKHGAGLYDCHHQDRPPSMKYLEAIANRKL
jgi:hypothetical protein